MMPRKAKEKPSQVKNTESSLVTSITKFEEIPEEWKFSTIGDLFELQQGKALSPKHRKGISPKPFLRTSNVFWGELDFSGLDQMDFTDEEIRKYALKPGDLLVCEGGDIGRTAMWSDGPKDCCYQNHLHRLRKKVPDVFPDFYLYWMWAALNLFGLYEGFGNVTTIPNLSGRRLKSFTVLKPPFSEQRKIAEILNKIREAIEATDKVITAAREVKKSMMHHLFTYGPVPIDQADRVPLKQTEIGTVPEHWEDRELGSISTLQRGKDLPVQNRKEGEYPVIGSNGIVGYHKEYIDEGPGVLVGRSGSVGQVFLIESNYWPLNTALWIKDFHGNDRIFIYYFLQRIDFSRYTSGVSVPTLNRNLVHPIKCAIPPIKEQRQIVNILRKADLKIQMEENQKSSLETLFKTMLHDLMTGKVRLVKPGIRKEAKEAKVIPLKKKKPRAPKEFQEAILIACLVHHQERASGKPVSRFRYGKLAYFYDRFADREEALAQYLRKAAGPYDPSRRYKGPEKMAVDNGYIESISEILFRSGPEISKAFYYAPRYHDMKIIERVMNEFGRVRDRTLNLWSTVDGTVRVLESKGEEVNYEAIISEWKKDKEWSRKIGQFSKQEVENAIKGLKKVFAKERS